MQQTILITGASSGIGRETALHLARAGFQVIAGVRKDADAVTLRALGVPLLEPVLLDVANAQSMDAIGQRLHDTPLLASSSR